METENQMIDESGLKYSKDGKTLICAPADLWKYRVKDGTKVIGDGAFDDCYINDIEIPEGVEVIDIEAFHWCKDLKEVKLPKSLKHLDGNPFAGCRINEFVCKSGQRKHRSGLHSMGENKISRRKGFRPGYSKDICG